MSPTENVTMSRIKNMSFKRSGRGRARMCQNQKFKKNDKHRVVPSSWPCYQPLKSCRACRAQFRRARQAKKGKAPEKKKTPKKQKDAERHDKKNKKLKKKFGQVAEAPPRDQKKIFSSICFRDVPKLKKKNPAKTLQIRLGGKKNWGPETLTLI